MIRFLIIKFGIEPTRTLLNYAAGIGETLKNTFLKWFDDDIPLHGAALAFYTIFSLAPLLVIVVAVSALVFGEQASEGQLALILEEIMGKELAGMVESVVAEANKPFKGVLATIAGVAILLFTSTTVISQMKNTLNTIFNVTTKEGQSIRNFFITKAVGILLVLACAGLLTASLLLDSVLAIITPAVGRILPETLLLWTWLNYGLFILILMLMFSLIYKLLPDVKIRWSDAMTGAFVTTLLFLLGRYVVGLYLGFGGVPDAYGAAGSFLILLLWVYYNSMIVYLGAEFTHQYTIRLGRGIILPRHARLRQD